MKGFLLVNKPEGISSFGVVKTIRRLTSVKKVGHAGTLDPFASGLLVVALSKAYTTQIQTVQDQVKQYVAQMVLGLETDTLDSEGRVIATHLNTTVSQSMLTDIAQQFTGEIEQVPPQFSAKKVDGKRAYQLARQGQSVELPPKKVTIDSLSLTLIQEMPYPIVQLQLTCSKGTYVRALVKDIANQLKTVAYTKKLVREKIGNFCVTKAISMDQLTAETIENSLIQ